MNRHELLEFRLFVQKCIRLFGSLDQTVTPCGFHLSPSQVFALQELEHKTLTVVELANSLKLDRSSVSRLVDQLVKAEFVHREPNRNNRREVILSLTEKGTNTLQRVRDQSVEFYKRLLSKASEDGQKQIFEGFKLFTTILESEKGDVK
ncbi:MarR family winged helix-turn-helix transcriptional regulator [Effusibacillus dendaii]|uniref:Transcriptional regulator n=1 Tax=Effusibacillus dendaii TaxID=2743772 RepID=A0A7I8DBG2_9BACL|nr:MarR family transcriptional regulator [Effusibacillus dendaii]BCJ87508.1 transcriptional regulator [Effusibacillus dendaii]